MADTDQQPIVAEDQQQQQGADAEPASEQQQQASPTEENAASDQQQQHQQQVQPSEVAVAAEEPAPAAAPASEPEPPQQPPAPQHPDYLGDLFQELVAAASQPAPFEGWSDLLTMPDSALLNRLGVNGAAGPGSGAPGATSALLGTGSLPGEVLTHPSRVLLRVLHRLNTEFRFLLMRQIDGSDADLREKREQHNSMLEQLRKDNVAKLGALLKSGDQQSKAASSSPSGRGGGSGGTMDSYAEMQAQSAVSSLERRLFQQQNAAAQRRRSVVPTVGGSLSSAAAGLTGGARSSAGNEQQRLKTYWRARYQRACSELEGVEQDIALRTQELLELDSVQGAGTNEQLKELIERCRVAEETAHSFAESCRMELKRAELAVARMYKERGEPMPAEVEHMIQTSGSDISSSAVAGSKEQQQHQQHQSVGGAGAGGGPPGAGSADVALNNASFGPSNTSLGESVNNASIAAASAEVDHTQLPFLLDGLSSHHPNAVQAAITIRMRTIELQGLLERIQSGKDTAEKLEMQIEAAHGAYADAVGRLPSHIAPNFEPLLRMFVVVENAEDSYFDAQAAMNDERLTFNQKRHESTAMMERERVRLMEQADRLKSDLRSSKLDLIRVERKRKENSLMSITTRDFTTSANTTAMLRSSSSLSQQKDEKKKEDANISDPATHLETMRARVKTSELERQSLVMEAMKAGSIPGPK